MADEKKIRGRPKAPKTAMKDSQSHGLNKKQLHACALRSEGMTQIDAYCLSHKVKRGEGREEGNAAYKLFHKPKVRQYLDKLWGEKPLEVIYTPQRWLGRTLDLLAKAEEAENWAAVANLNRQAGQAVTALRDSVTVVTDTAERDREIIAAIAGDDPKKRKALELLMGSDAVFGTPRVVVDNTKRGETENKGGRGGGGTQ